MTVLLKLLRRAGASRGKSAWGDTSDDSELREILVAIDPVRVGIARDLLEQNGIESFIFDGESSRMLGSTAAVPARPMVYADRAAEALELLKALGFED